MGMVASTVDVAPNADKDSIVKGARWSLRDGVDGDVVLTGAGNGQLGPGR